MQSEDDMAKGKAVAPDTTAVLVALWRSLHVEIDQPPHVLDDRAGLKIVSPPPGWRGRSAMDPVKTRRVRASVVARARFVEDLVLKEAGEGVGQYLILGAGLDTFAQRRPRIASDMQVYEVDRPGPQEWKLRRLAQLGYAIPEWLKFVPVDFEGGDDWVTQLTRAGFDRTRPAIVSALGVSMYLSREAIANLMRQIAALATGSTLAMTFMLPPDGDDPEELALREAGERRAREAGTPFLSSFTPEAMSALAVASGFRTASHVSAQDLTALYFRDRPDGLRPLGSEQLLVARS